MARVKKRDSENLTETNINQVITLLESEGPITKKEACNILNISYNTSRLTNIINNHKEDISFRIKMKKKLKGTEVSLDEEASIVSSYLDGVALNSISNSTYRSIEIIKRIIEKNNIPHRDSDVDYFSPPLLPEEGVKEDYSSGNLVFSARYNGMAVINRLFKKGKDGPVYNITVLGSNQRNAYQPYYELSDLTHIQHRLGIL